MAGFEKQGVTATSCEPFADWCNENGVNLRVSSNGDTRAVAIRIEWNNMLAATAAGDHEKAAIHIARLVTLEQSQA